MYTQQNPITGNQADNDLPKRLATFQTLSEALDYAAQTNAAIGFHNARGNRTYQLTYSELRRDSRRLACKLARLGLNREAKIGIFAETHPDFLRLFYACQYGGFTAVPLPVPIGLGDRRDYEEQLNRIIRQSGVELVSSTPEQFENLKTCASHLSTEQVLSVPEIEETVESDVDPESSEGLAPLQPDEISHIQYSSGSTRNPVGIEITQHSLLSNAHIIGQDGLALHEYTDARVVSWLPFYHDMGLIGHCVVPVACQLNVDYLPPSEFARRPLRWLQLISELRGTHSFAPDFGYEVCTRMGAREQSLSGLDLSCWKVAGMGGDMVKPYVAEEFANLFGDCGFDAGAFLPTYGMAEATLAVTFSPLGRGPICDRISKRSLSSEKIAEPVAEEEPDSRLIVSCGQVLPGFGLEIRDTETGELLGPRKIGEIHISGSSLMRGYHEDPVSTHRVMPDGQWLATGDLGYLADGELYVTGRIKDTIIVRGHNMWPQDIEWQVERETAGLKSGDVAAFGLDNEDGGTKVVVLVQTRLSDPNQRTQLRKDTDAAAFRACGLRCHIELIPPGSLPRTTSGKLMRSRAKEHWLNHAYVSAEKTDETCTTHV